MTDPAATIYEFTIHSTSQAHSDYISNAPDLSGTLEEAVKLATDLDCNITLRDAAGVKVGYVNRHGKWTLA